MLSQCEHREIISPEPVIEGNIPATISMEQGSETKIQNIKIERKYYILKLKLHFWGINYEFYQ